MHAASALETPERTAAVLDTMRYVNIIWSSRRGEYGFRIDEHGRARWCGAHADAIEQATHAARALGVGVNDGTPRGYRAVERLSRA